MWFNVNNRWCVNMDEVQYFGAPTNDSTDIAIMFKNTNEKKYFGVESSKQMEVFNEMCQLVKNANSKNAIIPEEGELPYGLV